MVERYSVVSVVSDDGRKVFSEVLRRSSSFWKDSARDKFLRESRHLYGGQAGESQDRVSTTRQIRGKTSNLWRKRLPSFRILPCLWGYVLSSRENPETCCGDIEKSTLSRPHGLMARADTSCTDGRKYSAISAEAVEQPRCSATV